VSCIDRWYEGRQNDANCLRRKYFAKERCRSEKSMIEQNARTGFSISFSQVQHDSHAISLSRLGPRGRTLFRDLERSSRWQMLPLQLPSVCATRLCSYLFSTRLLDPRLLPNQFHNVLLRSARLLDTRRDVLPTDMPAAAGLLLLELQRDLVPLLPLS
jgi:hypothetical protein